MVLIAFLGSLAWSQAHLGVKAGWGLTSIPHLRCRLATRTSQPDSGPGREALHPGVRGPEKGCSSAEGSQSGQKAGYQSSQITPRATRTRTEMGEIQDSIEAVVQQGKGSLREGPAEARRRSGAGVERTRGSPQTHGACGSYFDSQGAGCGDDWGRWRVGGHDQVPPSSQKWSAKAPGGDPGNAGAQAAAASGCCYAHSLYHGATQITGASTPSIGEACPCEADGSSDAACGPRSVHGGEYYTTSRSAGKQSACRIAAGISAAARGLGVAKTAAQACGESEATSQGPTLPGRAYAIPTARFGWQAGCQKGSHSPADTAGQCRDGGTRSVGTGTDRTPVPYRRRRRRSDTRGFRPRRAATGGRLSSLRAILLHRDSQKLSINCTDARVACTVFCVYSLLCSAPDFEGLQGGSCGRACSLRFFSPASWPSRCHDNLVSSLGFLMTRHAVCHAPDFEAARNICSCPEALAP